MSDEKLNRRDFFRRAAAIGASVAGAGMLLSACKDGGGGGAKSGAESGGGDKAAKGGDKAGSGELTCTDTSGLTDAEKKTRESLKYVDKSPKPDQNCKNCKLYTEPKNEGECGGCTVVAGPIHPKGYCISWQAAA
jgi:hypothetical protein